MVIRMIVDIINKKRCGEELSDDELDFFFLGYLNGEVKDYQMSALLMAICINGMTDREIFHTTKIFIESGDVLDLSEIDGVKVDKHSTGGVGDKTTLIISPIVASLGAKVVKFSGRGLGFTGGTIDKFESIPGFRTNLSNEEIIEQVKKIGVVNASATSNLVPLDKMVYALRDVTGTTESIPLIAISIMSKKIAGGADKILLDIKYGNGALLKNKDMALKLADICVRIGEEYKKEVRYILSDMNSPLGYAIGNRLEVMEALVLLKENKANPDLKDLCISIAANMVSMAWDLPIDVTKLQVEEVIESGKAYHKFLDLVKEQGGNIDDLKIEAKQKDIFSSKSGVVKEIKALEFGKLSVELGAGRVEKDDVINPNVGIYLHCKVGDFIKEGDILCNIFYDKVNPEFDIDKFFVIE